MRTGRIIQCVQGDPTWLQERCGRVTASRVGDVVKKLKNGNSSAARETYKMELLTEILTGNTFDHYVTAEMQWGIETEPLARTAYEIERNIEVERVGLFVHPAIDRAAASPDGLVGDDGIVEFKCPNTVTHLGYIVEDVLPEQYIPQIMWQLACTGRKWADYCSYDPRLPQEFCLFIKRLQRDDKVIAEMEREVEKFIAEVNEMAAKLLKHKKEAGHGPPRAEIPNWQPTEGEAIPH